MKIKYISRFLAVAVMAACATIQSCSDKKSYAELLQDENKAVNVFLADHRVAEALPEGTKFETGDNAPYYPLDDEGNLYMQVVEIGNGPMAQDDQIVYFRFRRTNLSLYPIISWDGNSDNIELGDQSFRYKNTSLQSSVQWGSGVQAPLEYLPLNSLVRLVVKSQYGWTSEIAYVMPFLYEIRYLPGKI